VVSKLGGWEANQPHHIFSIWHIYATMILDELNNYKPCLLSKFHHINNKNFILIAPNLIIFDLNIYKLIKPLDLKGEYYFMTFINKKIN
jgi:hypothetical protein